MNIPKCQNPNCNRNALMMYNGLFLCGECIFKLEKQKKENFLKQLENVKSN